jgi:hypothetical protein
MSHAIKNLTDLNNVDWGELNKFLKTWEHLVPALDASGLTSSQQLELLEAFISAVSNWEPIKVLAWTPAIWMKMAPMNEAQLQSTKAACVILLNLASQVQADEGDDMIYNHVRPVVDVMPAPEWVRDLFASALVK